MFTRDQDFTVEKKHGIIRCTPKTPEVAAAFKVLQLQMGKLIEQIPDAPKIDIDVNGIIGPSITFGVQILAQRLGGNGKHAALLPYVDMQPEEAIPAIAASAMEIAGYLDSVSTQDPTAVVAPQMPALADPFAGLKELFTTKRIAAAAATILGVGLLMFAARASDRRTHGLLDRSSLLPPSDGSDDFDEDDDGDAEPATGFTIDRENAIDVESVEHPAEHAA